MTALDPAFCAKRIDDARKEVASNYAPSWHKIDALLRDLADQLEAALAENARLRGGIAELRDAYASDRYGYDSKGFAEELSDILESKP